MGEWTDLLAQHRHAFLEGLPGCGPHLYGRRPERTRRRPGWVMSPHAFSSTRRRSPVAPRNLPRGLVPARPTGLAGFWPGRTGGVALEILGEAL
jgi:hypothetical protein